ncbi:MAG: thiolase family protein, partial [Proteobacteria bacterium]|nr:thiolase family protein [Pseudomonadota bacterium]
IIEVAQISGGDSKDNYYDQAYWVTKEVLDKAGLKPDDVGTVISATSDVFHGGVSCANAYYWEAVASFLKNASRQDGDSLFALSYAAIRIMSGAFETALAVALCKGSENPDDDSITLHFTDPFYQRGVGLNETIAAALQMKEYMERRGVSREQCARVSVKNLENALFNPYADRKGRFTVDDVLGSDMTVEPLTRLMCPPKSETFVAVLLASEKAAARLTDQPVWLKGFSSSVDTFYVGDRDLLDTQLKVAARRAYRMAGIKDPAGEIDLAELSEPYAYQELLWMEELGLCDPGQGGKLVESGQTGRNGRLPVNASGGVLGTNAYVSRGLQRAAEVVLQLRGQAGEHQVAREVRTGLAHGTHGFAGQCHAVAVLGL